MAANVTTIVPADGDNNVTIPKNDCSVTVTPVGGVSIVSVCVQIDGGMLFPIYPSFTNPSWPSNNTLSFQLGEWACPFRDTWYSLVVYAWDSAGEVSTGASNFRRNSV